MPYPAISLTTATVAAIGAPKAPADPANLSSTRIRAQTIASVTPSSPSAVLTPSIPVHRWIRAKEETDWFDLTVKFGAASYSVTEGRSKTIVVNLSPAADRRPAIPITVGATGDSAESGDYTVTGLTNGELPFVPGNTSASFTFRANRDSDRLNETVTLSLGTLPTKILAGSITSVTVTIRDSYRAPPPSRPTPPSTPTTPTEPTPTPRIPSTPTPPGGGGGGGGFFFGGFGGGSGSGGSGSGGSSGGGTSTEPNRPPYFDEGVATERSVTEHTDRAVYLGDPVTATDPDGDVLTYALGGRDADSFALDTQTGQLITSATLDFELKPSYDVVMTVVDGRGAADAIEITIKVVDLTEVPIYSPQTQAAALVKPGEATTIETPDGGLGDLPCPVQEWLLLGQAGLCVDPLRLRSRRRGAAGLPDRGVL